MTKALAGEEVTEKTIISDLFPAYEGRESPIVRVHKNKLAERIDEYYDDCEGDALAVVTLPVKPRIKGYRPAPCEAYQSRFSYNPLHRKRTPIPS